MGVYRFILAVLVVFSHIGLKVNDYNIGAIAVISFFILSGYVMEALVGKYYIGLSRVKYFYLDRIIRIYPQFFVYVILTIVLIIVKKPQEQFFLNNVTVANVILNFAILPLGFYDYIPGLIGCLLIPPAWTLGLELCFYLLIPFIITFKVQMQMYFLSLFIFILACFGLVQTELFGYRLLPGTLFIFLCGCFIYRNRKDHVPPKILIVTWFFIFILFVVINITNIGSVGFNKEVTFGILAGVPAVWFLRKQKTSNNVLNAIDGFFGDLSYGVFLNHFFVKWVFDTYFHGINFNVVSLMIFFSITMALSFITFKVVEAPLIALRRGLREKCKISTQSQLHPS